MSSNKTRGASDIARQITICGAILMVGYIALFCVLQSPVLWYSLRPDPVRSLAPALFTPINQAFSDEWVSPSNTDEIAYGVVGLYLVALTFVTGPLLFLLPRVAHLRRLSLQSLRITSRVIVCFTLAIMLVLLVIRGLLSTDIYNYVWYSRIWAEHGASPYTHAPAEFPPDAEGAIHWIGWPDVPIVYGPAWLILSSGAYKAADLLGGTFAAQLLMLRLLADVAHLLNALLVWKIVGAMQSARRRAPPPTEQARWRPSFRLARHPAIPRLSRPRVMRLPVAAIGKRNAFGWQLAALIFYIWNPLLLIEFAGSGHNDAVMLTFVLLGFWLYLKGQLWPAALTIGLATLIKLPALIFVPGYLWLLFWDGDASVGVRQFIRRVSVSAGKAAIALGLIITTWVVFYVPFWEGPSTLAALTAGPANRLFLHTLAADIWLNAPDFLGNQFAPPEERELLIEQVRRFLDSNLRTLLLVLLGLVALLVTWRARTLTQSLTAWGWVAIAAIIAQGWFWPWYVAWAIVPAALSRSHVLRNTTLVFTVSALLLYPAEKALGPHAKFFLDWSGAILMGPPLIYLTVWWLYNATRNITRSSRASRAGDVIKKMGV